MSENNKIEFMYSFMGNNQSMHDRKIAILSMNIVDMKGIHDYYLKPYGIDLDDVVLIHLPNTNGKSTAKLRKDFIDNYLSKALKALGTKYVLVNNGDYFKNLSGYNRVEDYLGYISTVNIFEGVTGEEEYLIHVGYVPNHTTIFYNPSDMLNKVSMTMESVLDHMEGKYVEPGTHAYKTYLNPTTPEEIKELLDNVLELNVPVAADIETFSLKHPDAGIGSFSLAWNQEEGASFLVDYEPLPEPVKEGRHTYYGKFTPNHEVRKILKDFIVKMNERGNPLIFHNITFDMTIIIYTLFMDHILDYDGLLEGIDKCLKHWDCSYIWTYLAYNSTSKVELSLKVQARKLLGNYDLGSNIKDIRRVHEKDLNYYGFKDVIGTVYVYNKNKAKALKEDQLRPYETIFRPSVIDVIQMQLTGMPVNMERAKEVNNILIDKKNKLIEEFKKLPACTHFKSVNGHDLNFNSPKQVSEVLFGEEYLGIEPISFTESGSPSTRANDLKRLSNREKGEAKIFLELFLELRGLNKIMSSFMDNILNAYEGNDGWHYLFGFYNIGGTVSGRLSSSNPNLQQIPARGELGSLIRSIFSAPPGFVLIGFDFQALEDKISALTTKDPNKLKVYIEGYDNHCLNTYYYNIELFDHLEMTPESINSIKEDYPELRESDKAATFLMTYMGGEGGLIHSHGFEPERAKRVYERFRETYKKSFEVIEEKIKEASEKGYAELAFGLRLRTPLLPQVILGSKFTPYVAEKEKKTVGNALGQSWCMLNSRAGISINEFFRNHEKYKTWVRPCSQIHDEQIHLIRDDIDLLKLYNNVVIKEAEWQEDPAIYHDKVKLGGEVGVYYPDWSNEISIPNNADAEEISKHVLEGVKKYHSKK